MCQFFLNPLSRTHNRGTATPWRRTRRSALDANEKIVRLNKCGSSLETTSTSPSFSPKVPRLPVVDMALVLGVLGCKSKAPWQRQRQRLLSTVDLGVPPEPIAGRLVLEGVGRPRVDIGEGAPQSLLGRLDAEVHPAGLGLAAGALDGTAIGTAISLHRGSPGLSESGALGRKRGRGTNVMTVPPDSRRKGGRER